MHKTVHHPKLSKRNTQRKPRTFSQQEKEDARDIATAKRILHSARGGRLVAESRVLKELGYALEVHN